MNTCDTRDIATPPEEQESLLDGEQSESAEQAEQSTGQHLLQSIEEKLLAREQVLEKRRKYIREQYW